MNGHRSQLHTLHRTLLAASAVAAVLLAGLTHSASAAVGLGKPAIAIQASPSGFPAGSSIFASATLGLGVLPTGTITFKLYGPDDPTCEAAPLFVTDVLVLGNSYYQSLPYLTNAAGTYRWTARYNGDLLNNPTPTTPCGDVAGAVAVAKRVPTLWSAAMVVGTNTVNAGSLFSGSGPTGPTGTLTFSLFGAGNMMCAGSPVFTTVRTVTGNNTYTSESFEALVSGTYQWTVTYSGDANNYAASTMCSDPANFATMSVAPPPPPVDPISGPKVSAPATIKPAEWLPVTWSAIANPTPSDWYALYALGASDSSVVAWKYTNGQAAGTTNLKIPWGTKPGSYELRLFANNSTVRLAVSSVVTVL